MRFWLRWAIVTLPVVLLVALWVGSYLWENTFTRQGDHQNITFILGSGAFAITLFSDGQWSMGRGDWTHYRSVPDGELMTVQHRALGFGYDSLALGGDMPPARCVEVPMWAITVAAAMPPFWLYRRQRKRRGTGFPVQPAGINSKESDQAQTA